MTGYLRVCVYTSKKMFPIKNARVEISRDEGGKKKTVLNVLTGENGNTGDIPLTIPETVYPDENNEMPHAVYIVKIEADGYVNNAEYRISVFDGIVSLCQVEMVLSGILHQER